MIHLQALTKIFHLDPKKVGVWAKLLHLQIKDDKIENRAIERLVMMRYLIEHVDEADALSLVTQVFDDVKGVIPVFGIINNSLLVIGADEAFYSLKECERVPRRPDMTIFTSFVVNVEAFATAVTQASAAVRLREAEEHQAPDGAALRSSAADPGSNSDDPAGP